MRLIFRPWTNTFARVSLVLGLTAPLLVIGGLMLYVRSPYFTQANIEVVQPVQFDHRHHVADVGIDCRYCHQTVEKAASAGYPPTQLCLNCHSQVWNKSPLLDVVRQSYFTNKSIPWKRVHRLPDFAYFNHSIHVNKGVGCESCHGRVDEMPAVEVDVIKSDQNPTGVGEPGVPPTAPAIANAWRALTGKSVRRLPFAHGDNV